MDEPPNPARKAGPDLKPLDLGSESRLARHEGGAKPWRWWILAGGILVVAATLAATARLIGAAAPATDLPLAGRLALLPFADATADRSSGWIETGLMEMVAETVARSAAGRVVSPDRLLKAFEPREFDLGDPATREHARSLALAAGAGQVLDVRVTGGGGASYQMQLELFDRSGPVASARLQRSDPLAAGDALAFSLARSLSSGAEPYHLESWFSRSPFVDRLYATGLAELRASSPQTARPYFEIAIRHAPAFFQAKARLADCARQVGELDLAAELTGELIREAQSRGERALEARSLRALASLEAIRGRLDQAAELYAQAYAIHLDMSDLPAQSEALYEMARLALANDDSARAEELYVEMLGIQQHLGDRLGEADTLFQLGSLRLAGADFAGAEQALADALTLALETGDVWTEIRVTASLGEVAQRQGDHQTAQRLWRRAIEFYRQHGDHSRRLLVSYNLAKLLVGIRDLEAAENLLQDLRELAAELGDRRYEAQASLGLTWVLLRTGYPRQAKPHLDRALELDRWLDDRKLIQSVIAWYAYEQGNYRLAVQAQSAIKRSFPGRWLPGDEAFFRVFRQAELAGRRLPLPEEPDYVAPAAAIGES